MAADRMVKVDLRVVTTDVPRQENMTRDNCFRNEKKSITDSRKSSTATPTLGASKSQPSRYAMSPSPIP
jgi:hypothetical protein